MYSIELNRNHIEHLRQFPQNLRARYSSAVTPLNWEKCLRTAIRGTITVRIPHIPSPEVRCHFHGSPVHID